MRKVVASREIASLWVSQRQEHARCSASMSFHGKRFLSYSTVIAEIVETANGRAYFVSEATYSPTTGRHLGKVRRAIPGGSPVFMVPGVSRGTTTGLADPDRILNGWRAELISMVDNAANASRRVKGLQILQEADALLGRMRGVAKVLGVALNIPATISSAEEYVRWDAMCSRISREEQPVFIPQQQPVLAVA